MYPRRTGLRYSRTTHLNRTRRGIFGTEIRLKLEFRDTFACEIFGWESDMVTTSATSPKLKRCQAD